MGKTDTGDRVLKVIITIAILAFIAIATVTQVMPKKAVTFGGGTMMVTGGPGGGASGGAPVVVSGGGTASSSSGSASGTGSATSSSGSTSGSASGTASSTTTNTGSGRGSSGSAESSGRSSASGATESSAATATTGSGSGRGGAGSSGTAATTGTTEGSGSGRGTGASGGAGSTATSTRAANAITVSAIAVGDDTIRQIIKLNGDVSSQSAVNIYPETSGKIVRVLRKLGDNVTRGSVLAYIDPSRPGQAYAQNPVLATVSGTITSLNVSLGETVTTQTAVATIGSLGNLKITVFVAEKYSSYLKMGLTAELSFATAPNEKFHAVVSSISPVVNSKTRTIETVLTLLDKDERIKQGMYAAVELVIREETGTMVVPASAVKDYNGTNVVYVVDENSIARRMSVTLGLKNDLETQILGGIQNGDRVITAGTVTDGSNVKVAEKTL